ncbi:Chromosome segregation in meiosis protein 3 [Wickerhamomyces ciferrii]|uniref:Chromosome segregation in meiosis protein n=1 Tax=Wickerhamomyces ciferrii (strain ATCC 14091 / BCRC 22168 / CBS 111 / JCM 3599 / NBRC 0793 / NRRL Y-1031 F-60-10) TaxID=1206466 RepID=K0KJX0_WICCF|nr:Chromosome segregation in meiosis protein 3 [Wickerhamomyces ciferrii]CCH45555.1 Chromosome segregation in meiosis protein 3 [Wickerhamomyces ciferrii]
MSQAQSQSQGKQKDIDIDDFLGVNLDPNGSTSELPIPKRKKVNNLNESHFLQQKGLPYLRKNCAKALKPRIQHKDDYKNLTNFLNFYQLWGHSIYPKSNFKDFLEMTTKVGIKSQAVKTMRQGFISEDMDKERESLAVHLPGGDEEVEGGNKDNDDELFGPELDHQQSNNHNDDDEDDDQITKTTQRKRNNMFVDEDDEENYENDDLYSVPKKVDEDKEKEKEPEKEVEKEAEKEPELTKEPTTKPPTSTTPDGFDDDFDDDDLDDLLSKPKPSQSQPKSQSQQDDEIPPEFLNKPSQTSSKPGEINYEEEYQDEWDILEEIGQ